MAGDAERWQRLPTEIGCANMMNRAFLRLSSLSGCRVLATQ